MELLQCPIMAYPWGSRTVLAGIQGRPAPSPGPEAELWAGAHPAAPSRLGGVPLNDRIAADPTGLLGRSVVDRFGARLPYLMKLLAVEANLSLQAHPGPGQAARGYAAEEAAGVPVDAPHRRYVDPYAKPELLVAVTRFRALCGFRDPAESAELLAGLGVPALAPAVSALRERDLRTAVASLLSAGPGLAEEVSAAAAGRGGEYRVVEELAARHPGDPGLTVVLLLNQVALAPGEAVFMPVGNLHAYLGGTGVEVMAASDNVLRGGLTSKHVDVAELLRVLSFEPLPEPVLAPVPVAPGVVTWPVPVQEFALHRVAVGDGVPRAELVRPGPRVAMCLRGEVRLDDGSPVRLRAGEVAFGPADGPVLSVTGDGEVYVTTVG
ncbi:MAG: mannose-6-phosphate isomerase, class I [Micromonosporaceae bacterium]|jgi:mannose-6-phosphate isomerase